MPAIRGAPDALVVQQLHPVLPQLVTDHVRLAPVLAGPRLLTLRHPCSNFCIAQQAVDLVPAGDDHTLLPIGRAPEPLIVEDLHAKRSQLPPQLISGVEILCRPEPFPLSHELADGGTVDGVLRHATVAAAPPTAGPPASLLVIQLHALAPELITQPVRPIPVLLLPGLLTLANHLLDLHVREQTLTWTSCEQLAASAIT
mmetsp:Transcript_35513/g.98270  ORF Transcript_35513/g.98270 Transcript_35513/m.98270 type:complete len:200 (-) Transcript_35513:291-890(-)